MNLDENIIRIKEMIQISESDNNSKLWKKVDGKLSNSYKFNDYDETLSFVNKVADIAKEQNHHPEITFGYNKVKITIFDHEAGKISEKCHKFTDAVDKLK